MTEVIYEVPEKGEARSTADGKVKTALTHLKETINGKIGQANFEANAAIAGKWYEPKIIATEQTRESTSFGTLSTPDEIAGIVVPTNGKLVVSYSAIVKSSAGGGRAAIFVGSNQLKVVGSAAPEVQEASIGAFFGTLYSASSEGLVAPLGGGAPKGTSFVTTGMVLGGDVVVARLAAGTYTVSVQYRATSGSVTAKERSLSVEVHGS